MKPRLLIVNDDGITSPFLPLFAQAMAKRSDVEIIVPAREQSWIGRAYNRHSEVVVNTCDFLDFDCHTVDGTPSDCVNIALSHLCSNRLPDAVISGMNIGQNIAFPLLWSSGTFAAAVEGAGWGFPAFAFSMRLEKKFYETCRVHHNKLPEELQEYLKNACEHAAGYVISSLKKPFAEGEIRNVNYPPCFTKDTPFKKCIPAKMKLSPLYKKNERGNFEFSFSLGDQKSSRVLTDLQALDSGFACHSQIYI